MASLSPEAVEFLKVYADLPGKLKAFAGEAFQEKFLGAPEVEVTGSDGERRCGNKGSARTVVITRSDPRQVRVPGDAPGASLVIPVNDRAIAPEQIRLSYLGGGWLLENARQAGEVKHLKAGRDTLPDVAPGGKCEIRGTSFSFRVRSWRFDFRSEQARVQPVGSVEVAVGAARPATDASTMRFQVLNCAFGLASPRDFWVGRQNQPMQILGAVWKKLATEFQLRAGGEAAGLVEILECNADQRSTDFDIFVLRLQLPDGVHEFHLAVPLEFYDAFREGSSRAGAPSLAARLTREIRWRPALVIGEQELRLGQLGKLGLHSVLVLKPGSARLMVRDAGFEWELKQIAAASHSGGQRFVVGDKRRTRQSVGKGGFMGALNIDEVPVTVQVVVTLEELNAAELGTYVPGKQLPVELGENSRVEIAVNGKILGNGKLVQAPNGGMGVQVLNWDV